MKNFTYTTLIALTIFSCSNDSVDDLLLEPIPVTQQITGSSVSFNANIKPIMINNCIACHNNPPVNGAPFALVTYNDVVTATNNSLISRISRQTGENGAMPLGGTRLPQNLIDLISQWKNEGYLEN